MVYYTCCLAKLYMSPAVNCLPPQLTVLLVPERYLAYVVRRKVAVVTYCVFEA
jgi:hypothetical protein